jgi:hypothetical protein
MHKYIYILHTRKHRNTYTLSHTSLLVVRDSSIKPNTCMSIWNSGIVVISTTISLFITYALATKSVQYNNKIQIDICKDIWGIGIRRFIPVESQFRRAYQKQGCQQSYNKAKKSNWLNLFVIPFVSETWSEVWSCALLWAIIAEHLTAPLTFTRDRQFYANENAGSNPCIPTGMTTKTRKPLWALAFFEPLLTATAPPHVPVSD